MTETRSPEHVLDRLKAGNRRFVEDRPKNPRRDPGRRRELAGGQKPRAAILNCADSRVSADVVFDQGLGDLFVIRNAGNVADDTAIASIEYAVAVLGVELVVVMGHEGCGAVQGTIDGVDLGHLPTITERVAPAVERARSLAGDLLSNSVRLNAEQMVDRLRNTDPVLKPACDEGRLEVVAAVYSLESGEVDFLTD